MCTAQAVDTQLGNTAVQAVLRRATRLSLKSSRCRMALARSLLSLVKGSVAGAVRLGSACMMLCVQGWVHPGVCVSCLRRRKRDRAAATVLRMLQCTKGYYARTAG